MIRVLTERTGVSHGSTYDFNDEDALPKAVKILSAVTCHQLTRRD